MNCENCAESFPPDLVREFHANGGRLNVCGVCALALCRMIHGDTYTFAPAAFSARSHAWNLGLMTSSTARTRCATRPDP